MMFYRVSSENSESKPTELDLKFSTITTKVHQAETNRQYIVDIYTKCENYIWMDKHISDCSPFAIHLVFRTQ